MRSFLHPPLARADVPRAYRDRDIDPGNIFHVQGRRPKTVSCMQQKNKTHRMVSHHLQHFRAFYYPHGTYTIMYCGNVVFSSNFFFTMAAVFDTTTESDHNEEELIAESCVYGMTNNFT